jgi:hypothetical protein
VAAALHHAAAGRDDPVQIAVIRMAMFWRLLTGENAGAPCLRQREAGDRETACLQTIFRAGSCRLRGAAGGFCRSCRVARRHVPGDRRCAGETGRLNGWDALGSPYLQSWDEHDARSSGAADDRFLRHLRRDGSCRESRHARARAGRFVPDGGSRLLGAGADL